VGIFLEAKDMGKEAWPFWYSINIPPHSQSAHPTKAGLSQEWSE